MTLAAIALLLCCHFSSAQLCPGSVLSDDFSNPGLWTTLGGPITGNISITSGVVQWAGMGGSANQRLVRDVGAALPNGNMWRIEWEFNMSPTNNCIGGDIMAVTSDTAHPRLAMPNVGPETNQNTVEVLVGSPNCNANNFYFFASSKFGTVRQGPATLIPFVPDVMYYLRLQRTSAGECVLSVFSDPARTVHVTNSPLCFPIDSRISDLQFVQMGLWTSSNPARTITAQNDNMCIYDNVTDEGCDKQPCEADPMIDVQIDPQTCLVTFTDKTVFGAGTIPLSNYAIDFGDGTTGQLAPGGSVTHFYPTGSYNFCVYIFAYDKRFECCRFEYCGKVNIECEIEGRRAAPETQGEVAPIKNVELYPNPGNQIVNIRSEKAIQSIRIYTPNGRVIRTENGLDRNSLELNIEDLSNGIYFFEINRGGEIITEKFSKIQ